MRREVQFGQGAILRYSSIPTLRSQGIEDDEDENEAPGEHLQPATRVQFGPGAGLKHFATSTPLFEHEHEDDFDAPGGMVQFRRKTHARGNNLEKTRRCCILKGDP